MTTPLNPQQREALDAPFDDSIAITGPHRSGKTTALRERAMRFERETGAAYIFAAHPDELVELARLSYEVAGTPLILVDPIAGRRLFDRIAEPLLDLSWEALSRGGIDPEVAALRSPERFLESAYRLVRKLRDAAIDPQTFLSRSLAGATEFYASPPNFAHADLLLATKDVYRDSLDVDAQELQRQYRREIDLAKVIAGLYESYVAELERTPERSPADAIAGALELMRRSPEIAAALRERYAHAFVDDMQEATLAQRRLLEAVFGTPLRNVSLAGDASAATSIFRGARPDVTLSGTGRAVSLPPASSHATVRVHRARTVSDEAEYVAAHVRALIDAGTPPEEIALIFRSSADVHCYTDVLLDRGIPVAIGGDSNVFCERRALDALALLWNVWDPFRHEWMLRTLSGRALALSDSAVALLCSDPPDPQRPLFVLDEEPAPTARTSRWDPKRDVRLGWNVIRGDQDAQLDAIARERLAGFRERREGWLRLLYEAPFERFVRTVWSEGLAADGTPGTARALAQAQLLHTLLRRLCALAAALPHATLGDLLEDAAARAEADGEFVECSGAPGFVQALSVDAVRGRSFAHTIVPDARPGSFPRWYVPDAFIWSPKYGMVPRENVGDAKASRTAKFSYYLYASKARDTYNAQERRAFEYALSRARESVLVTASGSATRGITAPEFLEELRTR